MTVADPDLLETIAEQIMAAVEAEWAAQTLTLPDRRYLTTGVVAADCEQLVVSLIAAFAGRPAAEEPQTEWTFDKIRTATYAVELWRCVVAGSAATIGSLDAEGRARLRDGWLLHRGLVEAVLAGGIVGCRDGSVGRLETIGPEGAFAGLRVTVDVLVGL